jgi:two-component system, chemotaxis family, chemotaxis protein CheY
MARGQAVARVLVVDDSRTARAFAAAALESSAGVEVTEARSGLEALKLLPQGDFDLVITDINMPDINGLELIRFARSHERYRQTPLIIMTTEAAAVDRDRAMALGADEYLVKPFTAEALLDAVRRHLQAA